jgi:hypothetical protein
MAVAVAVSCISTGLASVGLAASGPLTRPSELGPGPVPAGLTALGPVAGSQTIDVSVVLPPSDQAGLQALLAALYNPQSAEYQQWLSPSQFGADFGPSAADVAAVETWLHGAGLTSTSLSGFAVQASAPAELVSAALGTSFERYRTPTGSVGYLAQQTPLVPQSLAGGQISAILGLNTVIQVEPQNAPAPGASADEGISVQPEADGVTPCAAARDAAVTPYGDYYTLDQLGAAYGIGSLLADGQNGHGETIGVYELGSHSASDVATYEACFGLTNPVTTVQVDGGGGAVGSAWTGEADLDIEQVATQAPGASIISYEGPDSTDAGAYDTWYAMVHADVAQVISASAGSCEPDAHASGYLSSVSALLEEAAAQGQTVLAAAGDWGSEGCYFDNGNTAEEVDYPASDDWVTTVGGTELLGPGDEVAWNWCQTDESVACANSTGGYAAGGGGMSRYEARPTWQPNIRSWTVAQPCGLTCREVPDISANAGIGMVIYSDGAWGAVGGTSASAPLVAGLVADRNDGCTTATGLWTPALYSLASEGAYGTALTDITSGDIDMTGSNGGAYPATSGYDLATGLGSPLAAGLSCPEVTSIQPTAAAPGSDVLVSGLGLEHATIFFGGTPAQVLSATATEATVVVPAGHGVVTVDGSSVLGVGTQGSSFTEPPDPPTNVTAASRASAQATVSWIPPATAVVDGVTGYSVTTYNAQGQQVGSPQSVLGASTSTSTVTSLTDGTSYYFGVASVNVEGDSTVADSNSLTPLPPAAETAVSTQQYLLPNSDGVTWQVMDPNNLAFTMSPSSSENVLLSANSDLWTFSAGYNQDIGILVTPSGGPPVLAAWKESGGFAGTFSPNAAFVETVYPMTGGTTYMVQIVWKTNKAAIGTTIAAGAGPIGSAYSPTRLTADVLPAGYATAVSTQQYTLTNSNGSSWTLIDASHLTTTLTPASSEDAVISGNADLWTATAGVNQDIGIFVSEDGNTATLVAWKESGGFAGTFSPNAAYVQTVYPVNPGHTYVFSLEWKTNKAAPGSTIYAGAGPISGAYSPTRLTAYEVATASVETAVSAEQYTLPNSNGSTWAAVDSTNLTATLTPGATENVLVSGNADLWTATAGVNQDIGIFVSEDGNTPTLVAWKESGGFAGTFSPNAAYVQAVYTVNPGHTYVFSLEWKTNKAVPGSTIYAGAGPIGSAYSPTRLTVVPQT